MLSIEVHAMWVRGRLTLVVVVALQVLKSKERPLVSSVFFMCLPDKVSLPTLPPFATMLRPELYLLQHALVALAKLNLPVTNIRSMHTGTYPDMAIVISRLVCKHDLGMLMCFCPAATELIFLQNSIMVLQSDHAAAMMKVCQHAEPAMVCAGVGVWRLCSECRAKC